MLILWYRQLARVTARVVEMAAASVLADFVRRGGAEADADEALEPLPSDGGADDELATELARFGGAGCGVGRSTPFILRWIC